MSFEKLKFNLKKFSERALGYTPEFDTEQIKRVIPTGVSYLDRMLIGILPDDFMLIGAKTGAGKSELVNIITNSAAKQGKRVVPFALEAFEGEWELRTKYRLYMQEMEKDKGSDFLADFSFRDFQLGLMAEIITPYRAKVEEEIKKLDCISVFYRGKDFGLTQLEQAFNYLEGKCDLIVVDHLHYFDVEDENEQRAFSEIMKKMRDLNQLMGIPVVVVGHLRKKEKVNAAICPGEEEFSGTKNIANVPTVIITIAPAEPLSGTRFATWFRIPKCRGDGRATKYVGKGVFNANTNTYEDQWILGQLTHGDTQFKEIKPIEYPRWYLRRVI